MGQSSIKACNASLAARNAELNSGKVEIRTGLSGDIDLGVTGTLLETIPLQATAFQTPADRVASVNLPSAITTVSTAVAGNKHYVAYDSADDVSRIGDVGVDMILTRDNWTPGETLNIAAWNTSEAK